MAMTRRTVALGVVVLCVLATALVAAGLPAITVEPVDDGERVQSENATLDAGGGSFSGKENKTYRMQGQQKDELNRTQSMIAQLMQSASSRVPGGFSGEDAGSDSSDSQSGRSSLLSVPGAVFGVVALALVAAAVMLRSVRGSTDETDGAAEGEGDPDAAAAAAAAGRAADAVADAGSEESDLSNAVYRAWYEMTAALDVADPETATPGEFADAARGAGLDTDAVADLTTVFEAVRYGDEPARDYEDRALAALRAIERDVDSSAGDSADSATARPAGSDAGPEEGTGR